MSLPTLSTFQLDSLVDCANSPITTYMLIRPNASDTEEQQREWVANNRDTDELVEMGLLTDVSKMCQAQIDAHFRTSGRVFRVFRITPQGKAMFNAASSSALSS
jgi:hypothetical protein